MIKNRLLKYVLLNKMSSFWEKQEGSAKPVIPVWFTKKPTLEKDYIDEKPTIDEVILSVNKFTHETLDQKKLLNYFEAGRELNKLSVKLEMFDSREELLAFFSRFFTTFYLKHIKYGVFQRLLYNFDEIKLSWEKIEIAASFEKIDESMFSRLKSMCRIEKHDDIFDEFGIVKRLWSVTCFFPMVFRELSKMKDEKLIYEFDHIVALFFQNGIRFWLREAEIRKSINKNLTLQIAASSRKSEEWTPSKIEPVARIFAETVSMEEQQAAECSWNIDLRSFTYFPQVNVGESEDSEHPLLLLKTKPTEWPHWMLLDWTYIPWIRRTDIIKDTEIAWEWIEIIDKWDVIEFRAAKWWYVNVESDNRVVFNSATKKQEYSLVIKKISIAETWRYTDSDIWPITWHTDVTKIDKFVLWTWKWVKSWFKLFCKNVRIEWWDVEWEIYAQDGWSVNLFWNLLSWRLESAEWWIFVNWNVFWHWSYLEAPVWQIEVEKAQFATIIWEKIDIKEAYWCRIIWTDISIWVCNNCEIIYRKSLSIWEIITRRIWIDVWNSWKRETNRWTSIIFAWKKNIVWNVANQLQDQEKIAVYIDKNSNSWNLSWTLSKVEELNRDAESISWKNDDICDPSEIFMRISRIDDPDHVNYYFANFHDFSLARLNSKWIEFKEKFIRDLFSLFDISFSIRDLSISHVSLWAYWLERDWIKVLAWFDEHEKIMDDSSGKWSLIRLRPLPWPDKRHSYRVTLNSPTQFEKIAETWKNPVWSQLLISLDWKKYISWTIRDISTTWISFYLKDAEDVNNFLYFRNRRDEMVSLEEKVVKSIKFSLEWKPEWEKPKRMYFNSRLFVVWIEKREWYYIVRWQLILIWSDKNNLTEWWRVLQTKSQ